MRKYFISILIITLLSPAFSYAELKTEYHINKNFDIIPNDKNANKKVILITIDDGPSKYSKDMVNTLLRHNAKAIFFINGIHNKNYPNNITFEANSGFIIGNHTWDHLNLKKEKNIEKIKKEIINNTNLISKLTGSDPIFFRPPYGVNTQYVKDLIKKNNMISMNWSGSAKDWGKNTKNEKIFMNNVLTNLHPGEILLIHEHEWTAKYLDKLLTMLENKGYEFVDPHKITN